MALKRKEAARVVSASELSAGIFELWLKTGLAKDAHAGQFIGVYPKDRSTLLPRPISICEADGERGLLRIVYRVAGRGTAEFSAYREGEKVQILGILGNGYPLREAEGKTALLIGGGVGIPPLLELAKSLKSSRIWIVLGYRDGGLFLKGDFEKRGEVLVATQDGSAGVKGTVIDAIEQNQLYADFIYSCGPLPMLRAVKRFARERGLPAWISLEERMACGVGACLGCVCKTTHRDSHSHVYNARICTDGPVFLAEDVAILPEDVEEKD